MRAAADAMAAPSIDAMVVSDLHYVCEADHVCPIAWRHSELGLLLLERAYQALVKRGVDLDLVILLGDAVDDGQAGGAERDLAAIATTLHGWGLPVLAVPGNHDADPARYAMIMGCAPGLHAIGGYGFVVHHDHVGPGAITDRPADVLGIVDRMAQDRPDLVLVALQHNVLHPPVESDYPYLLANAQEVMARYRAAGVVLSLSGHYHAGHAAHDVGGVVYHTVPALCEAPFRFTHLNLEGRTVRVHEVALQDREETDG